MDIAKIPATDEIISNIDLTMMDDNLIEYLKDTSQFQCPECAIALIPASYKKINLVSPYFKLANKLTSHNNNCLYHENGSNLKKFQKNYYKTSDEINFRFPNGLNLIDYNQPKSTYSNKILSQTPKNTYIASTLFTICRTYVLFPLARIAMPLKINDIDVYNYQTCFKKIKFNTQNQSNKILFGLSAWNSTQINSNIISMSLLSWDEISNTSQKVTLEIDCSTWTNITKRSFIIELNNANKKAKISHLSGSKAKTWIFFIGLQDTNNINKFHLNNRKLISIIYATI